MLSNAQFLIGGVSLVIHGNTGGIASSQSSEVIFVHSAGGFQGQIDVIAVLHHAVGGIAHIDIALAVGAQHHVGVTGQCSVSTGILYGIGGVIGVVHGIGVVLAGEAVSREAVVLGTAAAHEHGVQSVNFVHIVVAVRQIAVVVASRVGVIGHIPRSPALAGDGHTPIPSAEHGGIGIRDSEAGVLIGTDGGIHYIHAGGLAVVIHIQAAAGAVVHTVHIALAVVVALILIGVIAGHEHGLYLISIVSGGVVVVGDQDLMSGAAGAVDVACVVEQAGAGYVHNHSILGDAAHALVGGVDVVLIVHVVHVGIDYKHLVGDQGAPLGRVAVIDLASVIDGLNAVEGDDLLEVLCAKGVPAGLLAVNHTADFDLFKVLAAVVVGLVHAVAVHVVHLEGDRSLLAVGSGAVDPIHGVVAAVIEVQVVVGVGHAVD